MGLKSALSKVFASFVVKEIKKWKFDAVTAQERTLQKLVKEASHTVFGVDHQFSEIKNYEEFKARVPIRDYEDLKPYIERVVAGEPDILWKDKPEYLAKTSGTT
ncbi:MAG: hypothetical protein EOP00_27160, partial [Pedobacter sp.]